MITVIYATKKDTKAANPFVCIYAMSAFKPMVKLMDRYNILGAREANMNEFEMVANCDYDYRIYHYDNLFDLVKDDSRVGVVTTDFVIENFREHEK